MDELEIISVALHPSNQKNLDSDIIGHCINYNRSIVSFLKKHREVAKKILEIISIKNP